MMLEGGGSRVWAVRQWEMETINALGWSEARWVKLSLQERVRKICANKLSDWLSALEAEMARRKMKQRG